MTHPARLILVRHGETVWHAENRYAGSSEVALTPRGYAQAQHLAGWARSASLSGLYSSPQSRAQLTAAPTAAALRLVPITDDRLRELHFGDGEGLTSKEMQARFPDAYAAFRRDPFEHYLPNGEPPRDAIARGRTALAEIAQSNPGGRVLLVMHNTLIRLLLCDLLGVTPARYRDVFPQLDNVAITEIQLGAQPPALLRFNAPIPERIPTP